jgi:hypothetical protein
MSARIPLYGRAGEVIGHALVDAADLPLVELRRWHRDPKGYVRTSARTPAGTPTTLTMHRLIAGATQGLDVDHVNGDRADNRRANLRVCTHAENMGNHRGRNGELRGVRKTPGGRWQARIMVGYVEHYLGTYLSRHGAITARREAELRLRGEFAPSEVA